MKFSASIIIVQRQDHTAPLDRINLDQFTRSANCITSNHQAFPAGVNDGGHRRIRVRNNERVILE